METIKKYSKDLIGRLRKLVDEGSIMQLNEISANLMVGSMILIMLLIMFLCWILNQVGIFTAEKSLMSYCLLVTSILELPIFLITKKTKSEPKWTKYMLAVGCIVMCGNMAAVLTHNVVLVTVIPILLSIRYYDEKFSAQVAGMSVVAFTLATIYSVRYGIVNMNVYPVPDGTTLTVSGGLRSSVLALGFDRGAYLKSLLINDYLPRFIIFSVIAIACVRIALRGRQMIDLQTQVSEKTGRLETELDLATRIQTSMLPCIFPAFPDHKHLELFATNVPAKEVGGDFYDYFNIDDDHVALVMADVSGKGVGAALFMTIAKIVLKNQLLAGCEPALAMTNANRQLCETNEAGLFVTTWAAVFEVSTGRLVYTNAGHNPPILRRKGEKAAYLTDRHGLVLAGYDGMVYSQSELTLAPGDELFLYTDGVTEATDSKETLYGEKRLLQMLDEIGSHDVREQIDDIMSDIDLFVGKAEQFDDITMMVLRVREKD